MEAQQLEYYLNLSFEEARSGNHRYVTMEHFLLVLLKDNEVKSILSQFGLNSDHISQQLKQFLNVHIERVVHQEPSQGLNVEMREYWDMISQFSTSGPVLSSSLKSVIGSAIMRSIAADKEFPSLGDLLVSFYDEPESYATLLLKELGIDQIGMMRAVSSLKREHDFDEFIDSEDDFHDLTDQEAQEWISNSRHNPGSFPMIDNSEDYVVPLEQMLLNLNTEVKEGRIDPLIGRNAELKRCWQVLLRRRKNNVLLVGDSGVGKTAIGEGLAYAVVHGESPAMFKDFTVYSLNTVALIAGTKYRGELEQRLQKCLSFLEEKPKVILFIDEIHSLVGAGSTVSSSLDISTILKPSLVKGKVRCVGTTTHEDYKHSFVKDPAFQRRFLKIDVSEASIEDSKKILKGLRTRYEEYHEVKYTDEAIEAAVDLSHRYIFMNKLPDKAIDVIDEAGAQNRADLEQDRKSVIDVDEIRAIVSEVGLIPEIDVGEKEMLRLRDAKEKIGQKLFGQDLAVETMVNLVKLNRAGLRPATKPIACVLLAGPTGVGKTELCRQLADIMQMPLVRYDMSEFQEAYTVSRLIGSPPGYVGHEKGGALSDSILRSPYCVLLLDEIEKAHTAIYDLLLQVMDSARLTDSLGRVVNFENVVLAMTTNAGAFESSQAVIGFGGGYDSSKSMRQIEKQFSPEFRNRLDKIIMFNALTEENIRRVVGKFIDELQGMLSLRGVSLELSEAAYDRLAKLGYSAQYGARQLDRVIQDKLKLPLADSLLFGTLSSGGGERKVSVDISPSDAEGFEIVY